jgi:hypothetical protein
VSSSDVAETCPACGASLAGDQRYCLEYGERRAPMSSVLLLAMGVGVLIGRSSASSKAGSSSSSTGAKKGTSGTGSTGKSGGGGSGAGGKSAAPATPKSSSSGSGKSYEEKSKNLPNVVSTG